MRLLILSVLLAISSVAQAGSAPIPTADELLDRCVAYHDPENAWSSRSIEITAEVRLAEALAAARGYESRTDLIRVDNSTGQFAYRSEKGADVIEIAADGDTLGAKLNGTAEISAQDREKHRLAVDDLPGWRDFLIYMYGLPMKLRDPGTRLDPEVKRTEFEGRDVFVLRVTYAPEVGSDIWDFFVDPETFALVGCRFFHDEAKNDGEYLLYEGEVQGPHGLRLPKLRRWYMNRDGEYIAADDVVSIE